MFREKWGRRVAVGISWAVLNYVTVYLQPILNINILTVRLLIEKSVWVAVAIVLGLTGTDAAKNILESKRNGGVESK